MSYPVYYPEAGDTLPHLFGTYGGTDGESITLTGLAVTDIEIYKDGSVTQRSSDAGYTLLDTDGIDFDGIVGVHGFSIDLSDNTDAGFYAVGSWYHAVVSAVTVDGQTVSFIAYAFRIVSATRGLAGTALPDAVADAPGGLPISDAGGLDLDSKLAATNEVTAARMAVLTDWIDAGRLDAILDIIAADVVNIDGAAMRGTDSAATAAALTTAQDDLDILTGTDGATLATAQALYAPAKAGDAMALTSGERTTLAAVIWNSLTSGMSTAGSIGKKLADWTIHSAADVWSVTTRVLTAATNITSTGGTTVPQTGDSFARIGATGSGLTSLAQASVATEARLAELDAANLPDDVATLLARLTATRAAVLDDLLDGGRLDLLVDAILDDTGTAGVVVASGSKTGYALTSDERDSIATALLDLAAGVETSWTLREAMRIILAACAGKLSGAGTATNTIRNPGDTKDRIVATVDADGNRSAVTYDKT